MLARYVKLTLISLITVLFVAFSVANREMLDISFFPLPYSASMPKFILAILCFSIGIIVAGLIMNLKLAKTKRRFSKEHKRVMALENELKGVRSEQQSMLPVTSRRQA